MEIKIHAVPIVRGGHKVLRILSPIRVEHPVPGGTMWADVVALWDTGATNTCIPMGVAIKMGIPLGDPVTVAKMKSNEPSRLCQFYLQFPNGEKIFVKEGIAVPNMQAQLAIGMDVIRLGTTTITPDGNGGVHFTFTI